MKKLFIFLTLSALFVACNKEEGGLEQKKKELAEVKKQYAELKETISKLEKEIAKLDGSDTLVKGKLVAVTEVKTNEFTHYIEEQGRVESDQNVEVTALFSGTVERIHVKEGQRVNKGQILAEIDASALASQIQSAKSQLEFAKTMYEKQKRLRDQNVGTEAQYLQAESQYESLRAQVQSLQNQYNNSRVTAPISGIIDAKYIKEGAVAAPGVPLFRVVGGGENKVVVNISESYISRVNNELKVKVFFPDLNKETDGVISNVSQTIDRASRTFQAQVKLNDKDVRSNMIAVVKILDYQNPKAIIAPVNAIQNSEDGYFVLLARKKKDQYVTVKQPVIKGISYNSQTEILKGLKEGDLIITTGFQDLVEDQPVRFKK